MQLPSSADIVASLVRRQMLTSSQGAEVTRLQAQYPLGPRLVAALVDRKIVTPYQASRLLLGRDQDLVVGPYHLLEQLGDGPMGQVFKARHQIMQRVVALRVLKPEFLSRPGALSRFQREVHVFASLFHPNIVSVFDYNQVGDTHYLVMEYVAGTNLARLLKKGGPLPVTRACDYVRQAALGLQHAFEQGVTHGAVKPSNLVVTADGRQVKIIDMGLTHRSEEPGAGEADRFVDVREDVRGLGETLYHLLTGQPPFPEAPKSGTPEEPLSLLLRRPEVPSPVSKVVHRMMAADPADRYATPAEAADALEPHCRDDGGSF